MSFDDITMVNQLPIDIQCEICYQMTHPIRLIEHSHCGKLFCQQCLYQWWDTQRLLTCPFCREDFISFSSIKYTSKCLYNLLMKQEIECPYSSHCKTISFEDFHHHHKQLHTKEMNMFDIKDEEYFSIQMDDHLKVISSFWMNPIDLNEDSGYENPVFIKWINEMTPWEVLLFPQGIKKKENIDQIVSHETTTNETDVAVFIGTIQSVTRFVSIQIQLQQEKVSVVKKAKHFFSEDTTIPGFVHFCSSSLFDFDKSFQCTLSIEYYDEYYFFHFQKVSFLNSIEK